MRFVASFFFTCFLLVFSFSIFFCSSPMPFMVLGGVCGGGGGAAARGAPVSEPCERGALSSLHVFFFPSTRGRGRNSSSLFSPWSPRGDDVKKEGLHHLSLSSLFSLLSSLFSLFSLLSLSLPTAPAQDGRLLISARESKTLSEGDRNEGGFNIEENTSACGTEGCFSFFLFFSFALTPSALSFSLLDYTTNRSPRRRCSREDIRTCLTAWPRCR